MIQPVNALAPKALFRGQVSDFKNPVNRSLEKRLALLNAGGVSTATGALTTIIARSYTTSWKHAASFGVGAALVTMLFTVPRFLYTSGVKSFEKEKELDVFAKEKDVQKKLLEDVDTALTNGAEDLPAKLDNYSKAKAAKTA